MPARWDRLWKTVISTRPITSHTSTFFAMSFIEPFLSSDHNLAAEFPLKPVHRA